MDKRTVKGRKFSELQTSDEKMLFLLEGIYDRLEQINTIELEFKQLEESLKFVAELNIKQLEIQNRGKK